MKDRLGREIEYLRISVTQNCNLNCIYCKPDNRHNAASCQGMLMPEEYKQIVGYMAELGIRKVRITGGEPLTRPDVCEIIDCISKIPGIADISMTTNGIKLGSLAKKLKNAGLKRLNISIDSLKEERYGFITGGGRLEDVMTGIEGALEVGLKPVRTNTVLIKGINDEEVDAFIDLAKDREVDVRFIELMPVGKYGEENSNKIVYNKDIIKARPWLVPYENTDFSQPAKYYKIAGFKGKIGFISPMSHKFCADCNRIRLTCDGKIKPCLGDNGEIDIMPILRNSPEKLAQLLSQAIYCKPEGHNFNKSFNSKRNMSMIGG